MVTIRVGWPEEKRWWRNFEGEGGSVMVRLGDTRRLRLGQVEVRGLLRGPGEVVGVEPS